MELATFPFFINFCADAVRTQYGPMRPRIVIVFQTLFVCLSLVRVPESRVTRGSGFLGCGEAYSGVGVRKGVVCRNLGLFGQRSSVWQPNRFIPDKKRPIGIGPRRFSPPPRQQNILRSLNTPAQVVQI